MKGREYSMPEKKRIKPKWVRLRRKCEFVLWRGFLVGDLEAEPFAGFMTSGEALSFAEATFLGSVSGR